MVPILFTTHRYNADRIRWDAFLKWLKKNKHSLCCTFSRLTIWEKTVVKVLTSSYRTLTFDSLDKTNWNSLFQIHSYNSSNCSGIHCNFKWAFVFAGFVIICSSFQSLLLNAKFNSNRPFAK